jgi:hypothetical protein
MSNPWSFSPSWSLTQPQRQFTQPPGQSTLWTMLQMPGAKRIDRLSPTLRNPFEQMMRDAPENVRRELSLTSGFRTYDEQAALKRAKPHLAAHPGHSRHELGEALDLGFASPATKAWVHANAGRYGLGFPVRGEDWHLEPISARGPGTVGRDVQQAQTAASGAAVAASQAPVDLPAIAGMTSPFDTASDSLGGALAQAAAPAADDGLTEVAPRMDPTANLTDPRVPKLAEVLTEANAPAAPANPALDETAPLFNIKNIGQAKQFKARRIT